jgi:hypothetical protein
MSPPPTPSPFFHLFPSKPPYRPCLGALGNARNVSAATVRLTTGNSDIAPGPASAGRAATAGNHNIVSGARNRASAGDVLDNKAGDGDAGAGCTLQVTTVVVLLNEGAVPDCMLVI